jgi:Trk-type K+ transport system membrane component
MRSIAALWGDRQRLVRLAFISAALLLALYMVMGVPLQSKKVAYFTDTGLGAVADMSVAPRSGPETNSGASRSASGVVGGVPGSIAIQPPAEGRRVVRTATLALIVTRPAESLERITRIAQDYGGYVTQSQVTGQREYETGTVTIRVPVEKFDEVRR